MLEVIEARKSERMYEIWRSFYVNYMDTVKDEAVVHDNREILVSQKTALKRSFWKSVIIKHVD